MNIWESLSGKLDIQITAAEPERFLHRLNIAGIKLEDVAYIDDFSVRFRLPPKAFRQVRDLADKYGIALKVVKRSGIYWSITKIYTRPVIVAGLILLTFLTLYLPTRILFVSVVGNDRLPDKFVLENAAACGISFGASRRDVRSEKTKNALLSSVPELRWVGVNTSGCVAMIHVQEKEPISIGNTAEGIRHIVASKDGIIAEMTVFRGTAQCKVGQAVRKSQVLVSGYTDHGISIDGTHADAEIMGYTGNVLYMRTLAQGQSRGGVQKTEKRYSLLIGKNLINFSKDSGISDTRCVRMYMERYLTLPGGFQLPLALVCEQISHYSQTSFCEGSIDNFDWMKTAAEAYLRGQMLSGEILNSNTLIDVDDDTATLYGTYRCREMIGSVRSEGNLIANEQRN